MTGIFGNLRTA